MGVPSWEVLASTAFVRGLESWRPIQTIPWIRCRKRCIKFRIDSSYIKPQRIRFDGDMPMHGVWYWVFTIFEERASQTSCLLGWGATPPPLGFRSCVIGPSSISFIPYTSRCPALDAMVFGSENPPVGSGDASWILGPSSFSGPCGVRCKSQEYYRSFSLPVDFRRKGKRSSR